jgi:hypothetical protein
VRRRRHAPRWPSTCSGRRRAPSRGCWSLCRPAPPPGPPAAALPPPRPDTFSSGGHHIATTGVPGALHVPGALEPLVCRMRCIAATPTQTPKPAQRACRCGVRATANTWADGSQRKALQPLAARCAGIAARSSGLRDPCRARGVAARRGSERLLSSRVSEKQSRPVKKTINGVGEPKEASFHVGKKECSS